MVLILFVVATMGSLFSNLLAKILRMIPKREPSPYEVLGIEQIATIKEAKNAFARLAHSARGNTLELCKLNSALSSVEHTLTIELYSNELLRKEFPKYAVDFFDRAINLFGLESAPRFKEADTDRFYTAWQRFRHEDKKIEVEVRKIVRQVKGMDPRMEIRRVQVKQADKSDQTNKQNMHKSDQTNKQNMHKSIKCELCNKEFKSENTMKDHLRSKQHKERGGEEIKEEIKEKRKKKKKEKKETKEKQEEEKKEKRKGEEHEAYRKCYYCKGIYNTRGELIFHIREEHTNK